MTIVGIFRDNPLEIKSFFTKSKGQAKGLHEMDFFEKIEVCKRGLHKYHQEFYNSYHLELDKLNILKDDRNKFAHQKMSFYEYDRDKVVFSKFVNKLKVERNEYSLKQLTSELIEHNKTISKVLSVLLRFVNPPPLGNM